MPDLEPDTTIELPSVTVLKASAGSGKTWALTERYAQFLLSRRIRNNDLRNILAITFSNNASREMRAKVLEWLKRLSFRDPARLAEIAAVIEGGEERASARATSLVDEILDRFSDFQVQTIDSFMSTIFRASALDFGYAADFEIVMDATPLVDYAFTLFVREAEEGSDRARLLDETIQAILGLKGSDDSFPWEPTGPLLGELQGIESRLSSLELHAAGNDGAIGHAAAGDGRATPDGRAAPDGRASALRRAEDAVRAAVEEVDRLVRSSGLERSKSSTFPDVLESVRAGRFTDLVGKGMKASPVKKPAAKDAAGLAAWEAVGTAWAEAAEAKAAYTAAWGRSFFEPYLRFHESLSGTVERVKRSQGKVAIGDIGRELGRYIANDIVPDVYFRLGERIWHFLIDEFQDTSPVQWRALFPLVENSLAMGGSLFVVGDTKQAIYGFRQADFRIMKGLEEESPFASADRTLRELTTNRRSGAAVLDLVADVFRRAAPSLDAYREAARRSGLDSWTQVPAPGARAGRVGVEILTRDDEDPPEKERLCALMEELHGRGWAWGDIALLAMKNDHIVRATSWLNERGIPFLSFSSLDVRTRRVAGEIIALLTFLDSPPDDLAFATFLLGEICARAVERRGATQPAARRGAAQHGAAESVTQRGAAQPATRRGAAQSMHDFLLRNRDKGPLYKSFQREHPRLWKELFAGLFRSAGYLPLYDLVSEAYATFDVFSLVPEEEATLAKLLEAVKDFEGRGANSLREFLVEAGSDGDEWAISVPRNADSVHAMTVHKSKGLGFPVVVLLLYGERRRPDPYTVIVEDGATRLVKITKDVAESDPGLGAWYAEKNTADTVDDLNALYVGLTRAREEMYVLGVKRENDKLPFDILPDGRDPGAAQAVPPRPGSGSAAAGLRHDARTVPVSFGGGRLGREERRRGELVHRALELLGEAPTDLEAALRGGSPADVEAALRGAAERAAREAREEAPSAAAVAAVLGRMMRDTPLGTFFAPAPGRRVFVEQEFCDSAGRLFRMDRVVVDPGRVTVIDFKTGQEETAGHVEQVRGYARILGDVFPDRDVAAFLAYVDRGVLEAVE